ncbi:MAG: helix-turn-helix domain-containing protein [Candidatus Heteroscillospira sp.]|jgi:putative transcriptional regulator
MISYANLWNVMKEKGISQYALIKKYGISPAQITRLKRNESVSTHTIEVFCRILDCEVGDIMKYIPDNEG